jgi:heat shock protein HslJ
VDGAELRGCGGDPASLLHGAEWAVEAIDGEPPVEGSKVSIAFDDEGRVSGAASCNRFTGRYALSGEGLSLTPMATTRMACPQPLMTQEQRVLALLEEVMRFEIVNDGALLLVTGDGRSVKARRP